MNQTPAAPVAPAVANEGVVVLFDFDGVLLRGDSFAAFMRHRYRRAPWCALIALPVALAMLPWWVSARGRRRVVRAFVHAALLGVSESRYRLMVEAFACELAERPRIFLREGVATLRRHLAAGDRVIIVTGCEERLVRALFASIGLHGLHFVASRLRGGWIGMRTEVHCFGARKVAQLAANGIVAPWDVAYTDSIADAPMLRGAREAVLVNGDPKTCKALERAIGGPLRRVEWK